VAGRQNGQAGRYRVQKLARVKTGRTGKRRIAKGVQQNTLDDLTKPYKMNWHSETGNTGINTLGKISHTWRGWIQSQEQVKQIRA
jgi:response regulator of citrate/malate metabolism